MNSSRGAKAKGSYLNRRFCGRFVQLIELHLKRGVVAINSRLINGVRGNLMLTTLLIDACVRRNYPLIVCLAALIGPVCVYYSIYR